MNELKILKVAITQNDTSYLRFLSTKSFKEKFKVKRIAINDFLKGEDIDLLIFSGGQDISPVIYNDTSHVSTYSHPDRDIEEMKLYMLATKKGIPMVGICRGAQFITALQPNGFIIQNIGGHDHLFDGHMIRTEKGKEFMVSSVHHQMMYPFNVPNHKVFASTIDNISSIYEIGNTKKYSSVVKSLLDNSVKEPEIVYYEDSKALCIQGHPEYYQVDTKFPNYCTDLITELLL